MHGKMYANTEAANGTLPKSPSQLYLGKIDAKMANCNVWTPNDHADRRHATGTGHEPGRRCKPWCL